MIDMRSFELKFDHEIGKWNREWKDGTREDFKTQPTTLVADEPRLSVLQMFRLLEMAHETSDMAVRRGCLELLERSMHPPVVFGGTIERG